MQYKVSFGKVDNSESLQFRQCELRSAGIRAHVHQLRFGRIELRSLLLAERAQNANTHAVSRRSGGAVVDQVEPLGTAAAYETANDHFASIDPEQPLPIR